MGPDQCQGFALPDVGVALPVDQGFTVPELVSMASAAEEAGFDLVTLGEVAGVELFSTLAAVALATHHVRVMAAVVPMVSRSPALTAMGLASLADLAGPRFSAGIGASSPALGGWHHRTVAHPADEMIGYVADVRSALAGEGLPAGVGIPAFRLQRAPVEVPILLAAIGPRMLETAGRIGDGLLLSLCPTAELPGRIARAAAARESAARPDRPFEVVSTAIPLIDGDGPLERRSVRRYLLPYAMAASHRAGFARVVAHLDDVVSRWERGDRPGALDRFGDEVFHHFGATPGRAVARCLEDQAAGAHTVVLNPISRQPGDRAGICAVIANTGEKLKRARGIDAQEGGLVG
jgi:alkanesulfonate monooxygenase SsuD/methylene tetrahydromethanopterin reductase-like flavin-dependent oxidoreductase (luciferase family)